MRSFHRITAVIGAALLIALVVPGCAAKKKSQVQLPSAEVSRPSDVLPDYAVQTKWGYASMPSPAPSAKPDVRIDEVSFEEGGAALTQEGIGVCKHVADWMKENPDRRVLIVGHANLFEAKEANPVALGIKRAEAAMGMLASTLGVAKDRMEVSSFGSEHAKADQTQEMLRRIERRVEFWALK
jgi:OOP family OmpA-OmpF porin